MTQLKSSDVDGKVEHAGRPFIKMHGLHNHFVIVDARTEPYSPPLDEVVRVCDVETGVGADQLLVIDLPTAVGRAAGAYAFMRIYNPDGAEVGACGNATRCVAYLLLEESGCDSLLLETAAGVLECNRAGDLSVRVAMGEIAMEWEQIPTAEAVDTTYVDISSGPLRGATLLTIGGPHAVFFVDDLLAIDLPRFAPAIQANPLFPESVNVGVAELVSETELRLAVWERPGVLTTACGSGACVAVYTARLRGLTQSNKMSVQMPAGCLEIELGVRTATQAGPVAFCFRGQF